MDNGTLQVILAMVGLGTTMVITVRLIILQLVRAFENSQKLIAETLIESQRVQNDLAKENRNALQKVAAALIAQTEILRSISAKTSAQTQVIEEKE